MDINEDYKMTKAKQSHYCRPLVEENEQLKAKLAAKEQSLADANDQLERQRERYKELEQKVKRPAPCERFCEATAFKSEIGRRDHRIAELEQANRWIPVSEFEKEPTLFCWIQYKGTVRMARYAAKRFEFVNDSGCYMTECISGLMPITPPKEQP